MSLAPSSNRYIGWDEYAGQPDMEIKFLKRPTETYEAQLKNHANIPVSIFGARQRQVYIVYMLASLVRCQNY